MGLLNPALLGLLGLGSVPILIHLLNRRRYQVVRWPAMAFLLRAQVKTRQRLRLENLLLLLARTLAVLLFAFAASRPYLPSASAVTALGPDRQHLYVLVDNSASMGYQEGISTLLQRAVREARSVVDGSIRGDDPVTLVVGCDEMRRKNGRPLALLRGTRDHGKVKETLERIPPSDARMDPAAALAEVAAVAEPGDPRRTLLVLSDFPQADWAPVEEAAAGGEARASGAAAIQAQLLRLDQMGFELRGAFRFLANPDPEDVAVLDLSTSDGRPPAEGQAASFEVVVANNGPDAVIAEVRLSVDGREVGARRVSLRGRPHRSPSQETGRASFPWSGAAGSHYAEAEVSATGNRLRADDRRGHAFPVRERVRVLLVDGDPAPGPGRMPETLLLETALSLPRSLTPAETKVVSGDDLARADLEGFDVVALANVDRIPDPAWDRLGLFVKHGGGLLVFLGDRVDASLWNAAASRPGLEDLLPARLVPAPRVDPERPISLDLSPSAHPAVRDLTDPRHGTSFDPPLVSGWWPVQEPLEEGAEVLLRLHDLARTPFLLERHHGRGRTLLCTTSADLDWTGPSLLFAPLVQEAIGYLASAGLERRDLVVHETLEAEVPAAGRTFSVKGPDGQVLADDLEPVQRGEGPGSPAWSRSVVFPDTARAGRYVLRWMEPSGSRGGGLAPGVRDFAVNLDPREADLARLRPEALEERYRRRGLGYGGEADDAARKREREAARGDLTGTVLALGALMVLAEMFLAAFFGRKRR